MEPLKNAEFECEPQPKRIFIGVSGGVDSVVLLDLLLGDDAHSPFYHLRRLGSDKFVILHVNHHLQPQADEWAEFVASLAVQYGCTFECCDLNPADFKGENIEAKAREGRYAFFEQHLMAPDDYVLLAHHQQDQIETFFLNLQRGAGLAGLAAMPKCRPFGQGQLARPLLNCARQDLEAYARAKHLKWVEDPSNQDLSLNRNFLRHQLIPLLSQRWPHFNANAGAAIVHLQEARKILDSYVAHDLAELANPLDLKLFKMYPQERQLTLLRAWVKHYGGKILSETQLTIILAEVINAGADAQPVFKIPGLKIYRKFQQLVLE